MFPLIKRAFELCNDRQPQRDSIMPEKIEATNPEVWKQLAAIMTPSIVKVVEFAKRVPGFVEVSIQRL